MHGEDGTIGHGLTMDIAKGLSIRQGTSYACILSLLNKKKEKVHL